MQYIQVKKEEFLASVLLWLHCEFRKDFARYVRAKDQLIGLPPSVLTKYLSLNELTNKRINE
jgi:hypothetical protein